MSGCPGGGGPPEPDPPLWADCAIQCFEGGGLRVSRNQRQRLPSALGFGRTSLLLGQRCQAGVGVNSGPWRAVGTGQEDGQRGWPLSHMCTCPQGHSSRTPDGASRLTGPPLAWGCGRRWVSLESDGPGSLSKPLLPGWWPSLPASIPALSEGHGVGRGSTGASGHRPGSPFTLRCQRAGCRLTAGRPVPVAGRPSMRWKQMWSRSRPNWTR